MPQLKIKDENFSTKILLKDLYSILKNQPTYINSSARFFTYRTCQSSFVWFWYNALCFTYSIAWSRKSLLWDNVPAWLVSPPSKAWFMR